MSEITITATDVVETNFGEKVLLDSPYEAKQFIKFMPWAEGDDVNYDELESDTETPEFEFSDGFSCHSTWDADEYSWAIDAGCFSEAREFFESVGITVDVDNRVMLEA